VGEYNINYPIKKSYAAFISNVPKSPRLNSLSPLEKSCQLDLSANAANQLNSLKKEPTGDIDFTKKMGRDKAKIIIKHQKAKSYFTGQKNVSKEEIEKHNNDELCEAINEKVDFMKDMNLVQYKIKTEFMAAKSLERLVTRSIDKVNYNLQKDDDN